MNFVKEGEKVKIPVLAVKAVGGGDWPTLCHAHFTLEELPHCLLNRRQGEPHKCCVLWRRDKAFPAVADVPPHAVQPIFYVLYYTNCVVLTSSFYDKNCNSVLSVACLTVKLFLCWCTPLHSSSMCRVMRCPEL